MQYRIKDILNILRLKQASLHNEQSIVSSISTDSRSIVRGKPILFIALDGHSRSGSNFIDDAYQKGVRNFIVKSDFEVSDKTWPHSNFILVNSPIEALQSIAAFHRSTFDTTYIAITGSNGKTIIKDWLASLIASQRKVVKSPKSYNSQIGVPLSLCLIQKHHEIGVFEAGISTIGEMERLGELIQPTIGIFTNLGDAHDAGFDNRQQKLNEKLKLFSTAKTIIYCKDQTNVDVAIQDQYPDKALISWSMKDNKAQYYIEHKGNEVSVKKGDETYHFTTSLNQAALLENLIHVWVSCDILGLDMDIVNSLIEVSIHPISMRLEVEEGIHQCLLINDTYNADLASLKIALDTQSAMAKGLSKTLILSDIFQQGLEEKELIVQISELIETYQVTRLISIGKDNINEITGVEKQAHFESTAACLNAISTLSFNKEIILIKGARTYELERVFNKLTKKSHSTTLEIDLSAVGHNYNVYQSFLEEGVKTMVIVKASAYGTGSVEVAQFLEQRGVDFLGVAFPDEGITLRKSHINTPILVLNPDMVRIEDYVNYQLDIEVYSVEQLQAIDYYLANHPKDTLNIHLKLDTGMHRLGFYKEQLLEVCKIIEANKRIQLISIFSHLAGSENTAEDDYSRAQFNLFDDMCQLLPQARYRHILNTAGIVRFPKRQYDMVRLGLGLYGIDSSRKISKQLIKAHTLTATIMQVKPIKKGEKVGYNQQYTAHQDSEIAIINIGYADGLFRNAGNERYSFLHRGQHIQIIGNICMDLTICLIDHKEGAAIGDSVTIFGPSHPIEELSAINGTIPYEVLSRIAPRVKRKYVMD